MTKNKTDTAYSIPVAYIFIKPVYSNTLTRHLLQSYVKCCVVSFNLSEHAAAVNTYIIINSYSQKDFKPENQIFFRCGTQ